MNHSLKLLHLKKILFSLFICSILFAQMFLPKALSAGKNGLLDSLQRRISVDSLRKHINYLGSDLCQGRRTGTAGGERAATYIAEQLKKMGLQPIGDHKTYYQNIPMHGSMALPDSRLRLFSADSVHDFELGDDYLQIKTGAQTFIPNPVHMVFAGYGIIAPEYDYNDYQSVNVEGKIAVYFSGEPPSSDTAYFRGEIPTIYSLPESKQRMALSQGAVGSILIPIRSEALPSRWNCLCRAFAFENMTLAYDVNSQLSVFMRPESARLLFKDTGHSLSELMHRDSVNILFSFPLVNEISFHGEFTERDFVARNVLGMLPGQQDSALIISAHYDHLGIGPPVQGDSIYNGVQDNAVGVAAVLEIARLFSRTPGIPYRSLIFLFLTGEEEGLLGSSYYVDHPVVPLYKTIAVVNVDGLAMFDTFDDIIGVGTEYSTLSAQLSSVAHRLGLQVSKPPDFYFSSESFSRSDQISFAKAGIPSALIMEGLKLRHFGSNTAIQLYREWMQNIYHSPFDDLNQPLHFNAVTEHCAVIFEFCHSLLNNRIVPGWYPGTPFINAYYRMIAEKR